MKNTILSCLVLLLPTLSFASGVPASFTYQGIVMNSAGTAPLTSVISLKLSIYDPSATCLLYQEQQANIDLSQTNGTFAVQVGSVTGATKRTGLDQNLTLAQIFANNGQILAASTSNCTAGYTPAANDGRLLRVAVTNGGSTTTISPDLSINAVPNAVVAETVQGQTPAQINPPGSLLAYIGVGCPNGFIAADGSSYPAANYPNLALALKSGSNYLYGGTVAGATFTVPDYRGLFIRGAGTNAAITAANGGAIAGAAQGTYQTDQMQGHHHSAYDSFGNGSGSTTSDYSYTVYSPGGPNFLDRDLGMIREASTDGINGTPRTGAETRPANASVSYCVKY